MRNWHGLQSALYTACLPDDRLCVARLAVNMRLAGRAVRVADGRQRVPFETQRWTAWGASAVTHIRVGQARQQLNGGTAGTFTCVALLFGQVAL